MGRYRDLAGQRFGSLVALSHAGTNGHGHAVWICQCDCGNVREATGNNLRRGISHRCENCGGWSRQSKQGSAFNKLLYNYRRNAKKRGIGWGLTDEEFRLLTQGECYYCGSIPGQAIASNEADTYVYNGIDRLDNTKDYFIGNCVPCCGVCNLAKRDMSAKDFETWILKAANHIGGK